MVIRPEEGGVRSYAEFDVNIGRFCYPARKAYTSAQETIRSLQQMSHLADTLKALLRAHQGEEAPDASRQPPDFPE